MKLEEFTTYYVMRLLYDRLKVRGGAPAAAAIGLSGLRAKFPHLSEWVARLERLTA